MEGDDRQLRSAETAEDSGAGLIPIDAPVPKNVKKLNTQQNADTHSASASSLTACPTPVSTITNIMSSLWPSSGALQDRPPGTGARSSCREDDGDEGKHLAACGGDILNDEWDEGEGRFHLFTPSSPYLVFFYYFLKLFWFYRLTFYLLLYLVV